MSQIRHAELAAKLAVEARRRSGSESNVRIFGCLPPICESHNPELFYKYLEANGESFIRDTYRVVLEVQTKKMPYFHQFCPALTGDPWII